MLFNLEADHGDRLSCYLVPDGFEAVPRLGLSVDGKRVWSGPANDPRPALVAAGRHRSGLCGFRIGAAEAPELRAGRHAELHCLDTGISVHRRAGPEMLDGPRLFRLETRLLPLGRVDRTMRPAFQGWYPLLERFGAETVDQIPLLTGLSSLYASGRIHIAAHPGLADGGLTLSVALRDPYEELAERLAVLSGALGPIERLVPERDRIAWAPAISALDGLSVADPRPLRRFFRGLQPEVAAALSNPVTRLLTCRTPGDLCAPDAIAGALRALAAFEIVATGPTEGYFSAALEALIGRRMLPPMRNTGGAEATDLTAWIADALAAIPIVEAVLECDLCVYASLSSVLDAAAAGGDHG